MFTVLNIWSSETVAPSKSATAVIGPHSAAAAIGRYLVADGGIPWVQGSPSVSNLGLDPHYYRLIEQIELATLDETESLGVAAIACMGQELFARSGRAFLKITGYSPPIFRYIATRMSTADYELENLPVPDEFKKVFRDWAAGQVDFVKFLAE
jgi:hypothetical protein